MSKRDAARLILEALATTAIGDAVDALKDTDAAKAFAKLLTTAMRMRDA